MPPCVAGSVPIMTTWEGAGAMASVRGNGAEVAAHVEVLDDHARLAARGALDARHLLDRDVAPALGLALDRLRDARERGRLELLRARHLQHQLSRRALLVLDRVDLRELGEVG